MAPAIGIEKVRERIHALPEHLRSQLETPLPPLPEDLCARGVIATGVGSSEAAARYLVYLLNRIGIAAEFLPLSFFYAPPSIPPEPRPYLAVFSQGLSPNAGIALHQRHHFAGTLLFTSSTADGQRAAGKTDRAALLDQLTAEGATLILHPMQNEYEILPRFIGPLASMLSACQVTEQLQPGCLGETDILRSLPDSLAQITLTGDQAKSWQKDLRSGLQFWFSGAVSQYAQNLSCKLLETLFIPAPAIEDLLTYAHGPFQLHTLHPACNWIFTSANPAEQSLVQTLHPLFSRQGTTRIIQSPLPAPLEIFYFEMFLNLLLLSALEDSGVNLVDWPGKGLDGEGYSIDRPGNPVSPA